MSEGNRLFTRNLVNQFSLGNGEEVPNRIEAIEPHFPTAINGGGGKTTSKGAKACLISV